MAKARVPNPTTPRALKPVELISDRAKRYRARRNPPPGPEQCGFCGKTGRMDIDHIDGEESNDHARNKMFLCRSCNGAKGKLFARENIGTRTRQYNPTKRTGNPTFPEYCQAVLVLRGFKQGSIPRAINTMQRTSPETRSRYAQQIARAINPGAATIGQYIHALHEHRPFEHDAGGAIIHATPKYKRQEYAADIWKVRKEHERAEGKKPKPPKVQKPRKMKRYKSTDDSIPF